MFKILTPTCLAIVLFAAACAKEAPAPKAPPKAPAAPVEEALPVSGSEAVDAAIPPRSTGSDVLAIVTATDTPFLRKAKVKTDIVHPLHKGHLIELMPGDEIQAKDHEKTFLRQARFGGLEGYVFASDVAPVDKSYPGAGVLWQTLIAGIEGAVLAKCKPVRMVADLAVAPGDEIVVYALGEVDCLSPIGVFDATGKSLIFSQLERPMWEVAVRAAPEGPAVLQLALNRPSPDGSHGGGDTVFYRQGSTGKIAPILSLVESEFKLSATGSTYVMTQLKQHRIGDRWLLQHQTTNRLFKDGKDLDTTKETFYEFIDGTFKAIEAPDAIKPLPKPEPTVVEGVAPMTVGE